MTIEYPIALSILASYFVLIGGLVWRITPQIKQSANNISPQIILFFGLAIVSFLSTWTYMFKFFGYSYKGWKEVASYKYNFDEIHFINSISYWLHDVSLFDSAWRQVCVGAWQWLWSHQLCSLTVAVWTPILAIEGARRRIPYIWAYMVLGQVVAISVASSLFFAVMLSFKPMINKEPSKKLLWTLILSSVGGIMTVIISPFVATSSAFMPNLLVMHILLIFPLASKKYINNISAFNSIKTPVYIMILYLFSAGANFSIYINQWIQCLSVVQVVSNSFIYDVVHTMYSTFFGHPAQSSISSDIVCMQFITIAWIYTHSKSEYKSVSNWIYSLIILTPILSASVTLPLYFAGVEYKKLNFINRNHIK